MAQLNPEAEKMIEVFSDFLNAHLEEDNLRIESLNAPGTFYLKIERELYEEEDDPPYICFDNIEDDGEYRTIQLYANPFHEESNILTGLFRRFHPYEEWELEVLIQYFDTDHSIILLNGYRTDAWPEKMRGGENGEQEAQSA